MIPLTNPDPKPSAWKQNFCFFQLYYWHKTSALEIILISLFRSTWNLINHWSRAARWQQDHIAFNRWFTQQPIIESYSWLTWGHLSHCQTRSHRSNESGVRSDISLRIVNSMARFISFATKEQTTIGAIHPDDISVSPSCSRSFYHFDNLLFSA